MERKSKTAAESFREDIEAVLAKSYARQRSQAVKRGMQRMVQQGYLPAKPPIGYAKTRQKGLYAPKKDGEWLQNVLVALADDRIKTREAISLVDYFLKKKYGKQPTKKQIWQMFIHPYYTGYIYWNGVMYEGKHVPLISLWQHYVIHQKLNKYAVPEKSEGR